MERGGRDGEKQANPMEYLWSTYVLPMEFLWNNTLTTRQHQAVYLLGVPGLQGGAPDEGPDFNGPSGSLIRAQSFPQSLLARHRGPAVQ